MFLEAGVGDRPVDYAVERLRDGSSFATRRVLGSQDGRAVVALTASFHRPEGRPLHERSGPTGVGSPDDIDRPGRYDSAEVDCRDVAADGGSDPLELAHWSRIRMAGPALDDPAVAAAALAWVSDQGPTRAARQPHLDHPGFAGIRTTSLDHHLWFHRPFDLGAWHVTTLRSEVTTDARGLVRGAIHDAAGRHVASLAQEVLVRLPT